MRYTRMVRRRGRRGEASRTVTWRSVGQLRVASVSIVVGLGTRLETAAVPGNFGPLEHHASKECKTMGSVVAAINLSKSLSATDATGEVICLVTARLRRRGMLQRERDISGMQGAHVFRRGNKRNNVLR